MKPLDEIPRQKGYPYLLAGGGRRMGVHNKGADPTTTPTRRDLLWAAGYLEGDGSFGKSGGTEHVSATSRDRWPLRFLSERFGGPVGSEGEKYARWQIYGARARGLMMTLYPLMSPHRQHQIARALGAPFTKVETPHPTIPWAAGLFEADGTAYWATSTNRVELPSLKRWKVDLLQSRFHGTVQERRRDLHGNGEKLRHRWYATGMNARAFAMTIYALLSPRRQKQVRSCLRLEM